ncbi:MAG: OmpA family protein [Alphaproteobacteria bacterium]|nr:OmpA family protein [Marinicaulis sp.]NOX94779.1 OmpA family protein [Alphaproteobacteria bacterium]
MSGSEPTIIIKKIKKVSGGGHHGGAWKVAYADFVTAMMAFFLLMWLLNATTEDQRKGIADYFNPSIPISPISGGGSGMLSGSTVYSDDTLAKDGTGGAKAKRSSEEKGSENQDTLKANLDESGGTAKEAAKSLEALRKEIASQFEDGDADGLGRHILTRVTPEGIVIELVDIDGSPLFKVGSTEASPTMRLLLEVVTSSLSLISNNLSITGHTDGLSYSSGRDYTNWELSTDRAHQARRLMLAAGMPVSQITEVAGKADTDPLVDDRLAPQNRRISITILKS